MKIFKKIILIIFTLIASLIVIIDSLTFLYFKFFYQKPNDCQACIEKGDYAGFSDTLPIFLLALFFLLFLAVWKLKKKFYNVSQK